MIRPAPASALLRILAMIVLAAAALPAVAQPRPPRGADLRPAANPSAVIAAELAFARLAQDKGQWTAFLETSTEDAEMFVPQRVNAHGWLKKRANPAQAVKWQPHEVWTSCDGAIGVTRGAWQGAGSATGLFTTVWQRQAKGGYKWVLDQGAPVATPLAAPDWIDGKVADCPRRAERPGPGGANFRQPKKGEPAPLRPLAGPVPPPPGDAAADTRDGRSPDGTLAWRSTVLPDGARTFTVWAWKDGTMREVIATTAAAPLAAPQG